jgi:hypothetical protein
LIARNPWILELLTNLEKRVSGISTVPIAQLRSPLQSADNHPRRQLRVFISYASPDLDRVLRLYRKLSREPGLDLWFDKRSLLPGVEWLSAIVKAIRSSDVVLICLSSRSLHRIGFAQKEIKWAIETADNQPEGTVSILPIKLEPCDLRSRRLMRWQYAELFRKGGYEQVVGALLKKAQTLEATS